jgi:hypothetical protein
LNPSTLVSLQSLIHIYITEWKLQQTLSYHHLRACSPAALPLRRACSPRSATRCVGTTYFIDRRHTPTACRQASHALYTTLVRCISTVVIWRSVLRAFCKYG